MLTSTAVVLLGIQELSLCNFCFLESSLPPLVSFASVLFCLGAYTPGPSIPPFHTWFLLCFLYPFIHTVFVYLQPDGSSSFTVWMFVYRLRNLFLLEANRRGSPSIFPSHKQAVVSDLPPPSHLLTPPQFSVISGLLFWSIHFFVISCASTSGPSHKSKYLMRPILPVSCFHQDNLPLWALTCEF